MLIHIGYHKTATSWLQALYFSQHPNIHYPIEYEQLWQHLISPHGLEFDLHHAQQYFNTVFTAPANKIPVISSERLSGNPHSGGFDSKEIANRLKQLFPHAKILIVVRNQVDMILSNYKQYIKAGGIVTLNDYMHPPVDGRLPLFRLDNFKYDKLAAYYCQLYGKENVSVMLYEQFQQQPLQFINLLNEFIGITTPIAYQFQQQVNKSPSDSYIALKRYANHLNGGSSFLPKKVIMPRLYQKIIQGLEYMEHFQWIQQKKYLWHTQIEQDIQNYYAESNHMLNKSFSLSLENYTYCLTNK